MKDIMYFGCLLTGDCKHTVSGLTDEYGNPVRVVLEKDGDDVMLAVFYEDDEGDDDYENDCGECRGVRC